MELKDNRTAMCSMLQLKRALSSIRYTTVLSLLIILVGVVTHKGSIGLKIGVVKTLSQAICRQTNLYAVTNKLQKPLMNKDENIFGLQKACRRIICAKSGGRCGGFKEAPCADPGPNDVRAWSEASQGSKQKQVKEGNVEASDEVTVLEENTQPEQAKGQPGESRKKRADVSSKRKKRQTPPVVPEFTTIPEYKFQMECYSISTFPLTHAAARDMCASRGWNLFSIDSLTEWTKVMPLLVDGFNMSYWTSATDEETEGDWKWYATCDKVTAGNFTPGEQNSPTKNCLALATGNAADIQGYVPTNCNASLRFVCERASLFCTPVTLDNLTLGGNTRRHRDVTSFNITTDFDKPRNNPKLNTSMDWSLGNDVEMSEDREIGGTRMARNVMFNRSCYYISTGGEMNEGAWASAKDICVENHNSDVIAIENAAEFNYVWGIINAHHLSEDQSATESLYWTSGNDIVKENNFIWRSTCLPITYTPSKTTFNQENNEKTNCVAFHWSYQSSKFKLVPCDTSLPVICKSKESRCRFPLPRPNPVLNYTIG